MDNIDELLKEATELMRNSEGGMFSGETAAQALSIAVADMRKKKSQAEVVDYLKDTIEGYKSGRYPLQ